jgi:hypothetical protein
MMENLKRRGDGRNEFESGNKGPPLLNPPPEEEREGDVLRGVRPNL